MLGYRATIMKYYQMSDSNKRIYYLMVLEARSLESRSGRAMLPLKAVWKSLFLASS